MSRATLAPFVTVLVACGGTSMPAHPDAPVAAVADAAATERPEGVALCYTATAAADPAVGAFAAALRAEDRAARAQIIADLEAAATALPDEEQVHLYTGLAQLWRLAEPLPGEDDLLTQATSAIAARDRLRRAYELCPTDHRIAAWLGPVLVRMGRALSDQATIDEGLAVLDAGIAAYPAFVLFSKLLVYADFPRTAPEYQNALAAVVDDLDACNARPHDPACSDANVPHNREGGTVFLGDALAKAGDRAGALAAYDGGAAEPGFASWSYQAVLTGRIADLDARIAAFANDDPGDDPEVAWAVGTQCALCHQQ